MVAVTLLVTVDVETVNVPEDAPTGIARLPGSFAAAALEALVTTAPPEGAAEASVTVHVLG